MARQWLKGSSRTREGGDPYLAFLVFAGLGLGTWAMEPQVRLTILWIALAAAVLNYAQDERLELDYSLLNLGRGALLGLIVSLPLLVFLKDPMLVGKAEERIRDNQETPEYALTEIITEAEKIFSQKEDPVFRERGADIRDVAYRIIGNLMGTPSRVIDITHSPQRFN